MLDRAEEELGDACSLQDWRRDSEERGEDLYPA